MTRLEQRNQKVIQKSLTRLRTSEQKTAENAMRKIVMVGLEYLIDAHNMHDMFMSHTQENDTLGYALAHDGMIVMSGQHNGGNEDLPGNAKEKAINLLSGTQGWVAVILSDMQGWYRVDYETDFLLYSAEQVRQDFNRFFKPVKR